ncbi:hypothetical protein H920_18974 [Fukomys damarensis]|uniref:Uncharacterized protein n=1 Tax=Fukomys damarensis TaxID=885580 RepID=A0A091CPU6_FUKDA|nr:hypothetical protein H920_18974 [Fukomys damarensis]
MRDDGVFSTVDSSTLSAWVELTATPPGQWAELTGEDKTRIRSQKDRELQELWYSPPRMRAWMSGAGSDLQEDRSNIIFKVFCRQKEDNKCKSPAQDRLRATHQSLSSLASARLTSVMAIVERQVLNVKERQLCFGERAPRVTAAEQYQKGHTSSANLCKVGQLRGERASTAPTVPGKGTQDLDVQSYDFWKPERHDLGFVNKITQRQAMEEEPEPSPQCESSTRSQMPTDPGNTLEFKFEGNRMSPSYTQPPHKDRASLGAGVHE